MPWIVVRIYYRDAEYDVTFYIMDLFRIIYAILLMCFLAITVAGVVKDTTDFDTKTNDEKIKSSFTIIFTGISGILVLFFLYKMVSR